MCSFLGLASFYRCFIRNFSTIATGLTNCLKKGSFLWTSEARHSFDELKTRIASAPVLALPDFKKLFIVECDGCNLRIGGVLSQERHPIAFYCEKSGEGRRHWTTYEIKLYAVVRAFKNWEPYLIQRDFIVRSEHITLKDINAATTINRMHLRWIAFLQRFTFTILHKPGQANKVADALSRKGETLSYVRVQIPEIDDIKKNYIDDEDFGQIWSEIQSGGQFQGFSLKNGFIFADHRLCIPKGTLRLKLIRELHCNNLGGHAGMNKTFHLLEERFFWPGLRQELKKFVKRCLSCQRTKSGPPTQGLYTPLPIPSRPWEDISLDFITGLPRSPAGKDAICVVIDRFSRMAHFLPCKKTDDASRIAELFIKEIVRLHRLPTSIVSDRDPKFVGHF